MFLPREKAPEYLRLRINDKNNYNDLLLIVTHRVECVRLLINLIDI